MLLQFKICRLEEEMDSSQQPESQLDISSSTLHTPHHHQVEDAVSPPRQGKSQGRINPIFLVTNFTRANQGYSQLAITIKSPVNWGSRENRITPLHK